MVAGPWPPQPMEVLAELKSLLLFRSRVSVLTPAVLKKLAGGPGLTLNVAWTVTVCPLVTVAMMQGKAEQPPPLTETSVRRGGVGSLTTTLVASDGPRFVTAR